MTVTQAMYDCEFGKLVPSSRSKQIVIENRLPENFKSNAGATKTDVSIPIRIGWTGNLRNPELYEPLLEAIGKDGGKRVALEVWGGGLPLEMAKLYSQKYENIKIRGTYREDPESLRAMHESVDVQVLLELADNENVRVTVPNRLSHCLIYQTPLIVTKGTEMARRIDELGMGFAIDPLTVKWDDVFDQLADGQLMRTWLSNLQKVPDKLRYLDSSPLINAIHLWNGSKS